MTREKIKVPGKAYEELIALQREIHFTQDHADTIKKAEDRGYMNAANWIRQNEESYKIGFAWGFEPSGYEAEPVLRDIPEPRSPPMKRTISHAQTIEPRSTKKSGSSRSGGSKSSGGFFAGIKNWLGKYF